ncbi:MAG: ABC transporter substrate-binding protein [Chloroflexota bacterium]
MHPQLNTLIRVLFYTSLLSGLLWLTACQSPSAPETLPEIRIGLLAPLSGPSAESAGRSTLNAARLAVSEINEAGGLLVGEQRYYVVLVESDDGGTAETAVQAAQRLINQENIVALIGPPFSSTAEAVAALANESRIPLITPTATNPGITPNRPYIFRATFDDNFQSVALASFIRTKLEYNRVAILYDISNNYSRELAETFQQAFSERGGDVVAVETYTADTNTTFSSQIQAIAAGQPQAIFLPNFTNDVLQQGNEIEELGLDVTLIGGDSWQGERLSAQGNFVGAFFSGNYCRDLTNERIRRFVEKYERSYDTTPDGLAALTYDSFHLLFAAIVDQNKFEADTILNGLYNIVYEGVTGTIKFDTNGNPDNKAVAIWIIEESERRCYTVIAPND